MKKILFTSLFLFSCAITFAGGYRVGLQGQRALAMGHTGVAYVNSAEIAFFNPAGLVFLENKINVSAGGFGVFSDVAWQNTSTGQFSNTDSSAGTPFYLYGSYALNERFSLGLAVYTPYGSGVEWPTDWAGSHLVNDIDLAAIYIQPLVSFKINDRFSVGGGPIFVTGSVNFNRNANRTLTDLEGNRSNITVDDSGVTNWGWSVGTLFNVTDDLSIGASYRSEIILESTEGVATFANFPDSPLVPDNGETSFEASLPLPAELTVGLSYQRQKWAFNFDFTRTFWDVYEDLDIVFGNGQESINPRNYDNSSIYKFGFAYQASEKFSLRAGYYYDQTPIRSGYFAPETPRNDGHGFTAGLSYAISNNFAIDASFLYLRFEEIDESYDYVSDGSSFGGTYKSSAFAPGIGVTYKM
ncbi:OmpP1/FadL family transporter [Leeuwenhoekiella aequorea]|uniref:Long-chain fatty acid transport protein n=1 Tax=Leeuwenhoekiella aequorea TaxID=283736 RepID=A0A4Q0PDW4_9FLAO|nr:outer membrane protein transport protein [Leeuwenhoekiella aequorea]RXG24698.1 long-chain fatty acid transport protein [Leeuwenhoekiella aequorea]